MILSNPVKNSPAIHVRKLLEHLSGPIPVEAYPLVQRFTQIRFTPLRSFLSPEEQAWHSPAHVAQMVSRFPLTPDQRSVLMHFLATSGDGQIIAVTGPPWYRQDHPDPDRNRQPVDGSRAPTGRARPSGHRGGIDQQSGSHERH